MESSGLTCRETRSLHCKILCSAGGKTSAATILHDVSYLEYKLRITDNNVVKLKSVPAAFESITTDGSLIGNRRFRFAIPDYRFDFVDAINLTNFITSGENNAIRHTAANNSVRFINGILGFLIMYKNIPIMKRRLMTP